VASLWPEQRARPWLSPRAIRVVLGLLAVMALAGWFLLSPAGEWPPFQPGAGQFLGALAAVALLAAVARRLRHRPAHASFERRWPLFLAGLGWGPWLLGTWIISEQTRAAWPTMTWTLVVAATLLAFAYRRLRALDRRALLGAGTLAAGTWLFWSLLAIIQELDNGNRPDDTTGMALVGLLALALLLAYLFYLRRAWRRLEPLNRAEPNPGSDSRPAGAASV